VLFIPLFLKYKKPRVIKCIGQAVSPLNGCAISLRLIMNAKETIDTVWICEFPFRYNLWPNKTAIVSHTAKDKFTFNEQIFCRRTIDLKNITCTEKNCTVLPGSFQEKACNPSIKKFFFVYFIVVTEVGSYNPNIPEIAMNSTGNSLDQSVC
jgi:hypothetical protein